MFAFLPAPAPQSRQQVLVHQRQRRQVQLLQRVSHHLRPFQVRSFMPFFGLVLEFTWSMYCLTKTSNCLADKNHLRRKKANEKLLPIRYNGFHLTGIATWLLALIIIGVLLILIALCTALYVLLKRRRRGKRWTLLLNISIAVQLRMISVFCLDFRVRTGIG